MTLYDKLHGSPAGRRALAAARLRYRVLSLLNQALEASGLTQSAVAGKLTVRRSAANQVFRGSGNLRVNTVADYLDAMGFELTVALAPSGTARQAAQSWRAASPVPSVRAENLRSEGFTEASSRTTTFETPAEFLDAYGARRDDFTVAA